MLKRIQGGYGGYIFVFISFVFMVVSHPKALVKTLAKNLVKNLAKNLDKNLAKN